MNELNKIGLYAIGTVRKKYSETNAPNETR